MKSAGDFGKLDEGGLQVFDDLKLVRFPRSLAPTLVTLPSMSLIPFAPFPYSYQPNATRLSEIALYKSYSKLFSAM